MNEMSLCSNPNHLMIVFSYRYDLYTINLVRNEILSFILIRDQQDAYRVLDSNLRKKIEFYKNITEIDVGGIIANFRASSSLLAQDYKCLCKSGKVKLRVGVINQNDSIIKFRDNNNEESNHVNKINDIFALSLFTTIASNLNLKYTKYYLNKD
jgi:hypothetical protein